MDLELNMRSGSTFSDTGYFRQLSNIGGCLCAPFGHMRVSGREGFASMCKKIVEFVVDKPSIGHDAPCSLTTPSNFIVGGILCAYTRTHARAHTSTHIQKSDVASHE